MTLEGWDHVPRGYGADFDLGSAPWWLRLSSRTPFLDRYAYPRLVRRGYGYLTPFPDHQVNDREPIRGGWRLRDRNYIPPGSTTDLR